jgi:hypothetical protein
MMKTTYFKYENGVYSILSNGQWSVYVISEQGKNISSLITEKMREQYTEEQAIDAEGLDPNSGVGLAYWTKVSEMQSEILTDFASFESQL